MKTKSRAFLFIKLVLIYLTFLYVIISLNFLINVGDILKSDILPVIGGLFFLAIYVSMSIINISFFIRRKEIDNYKTVLFFNSIFSLLSGIGGKIAGFVLINDIGADVSVAYFYGKQAPGLFLHYDLFNFVIKFYKDDPQKNDFGFGINLVMLAISVFLFICYRKIQNWFVVDSPPS